MTADSPFAPDFPQNPLSHLHPMRGKKKEKSCSTSNQNYYLTELYNLIYI